MIPKSLNIQGVKWSVKIVKDLADENGRACHGLCIPYKKTILIRGDDPKTMQMETFIHECTHAICAQSGLWQAPSWSVDLEEILADQLANFFVTNKISLAFPIKKKKKKKKIIEVA